VCLSRHLLPGRGASAISPLGGTQYTVRHNLVTNRPHAFSFAVADELSEAHSDDCPGQDETAEGSWYY
jgi:hypothetical protein